MSGAITEAPPGAVEAVQRYDQRKMMRVAVVAVVLLLATAGLLRLFVFTNARAISKVLEKDKAVFVQKEAAIKGGTRPPIAIAEMVKAMKAIDTSSCPSEFRVAYTNHCHAWQDVADQLQKKSDAVSDALVALGFRWLLASQGVTVPGKWGTVAALGALPGTAKQNQALTKSWQDVEAVCAKYNVKMLKAD